MRRGYEGKRKKHNEINKEIVDFEMLPVVKFVPIVGGGLYSRMRHFSNFSGETKNCFI